MDPSAVATKHVSDKVQELNSLLAKTLRIAIQDGRSFVGELADLRVRMAA
jgi:hypothetical protein